MSERTPEARKAARGPRMWARVVALGAEPTGDVLRHSTVAERLAMVDQLSAEVWAHAGQSPTLSDQRGTPIRVIPLSRQ